MLITLDNKTSAAIEEGARLFLINQRPNSVEVAFRMRALQEISQSMSTERLLTLVQICAEAGRTGQLRAVVEQYVAALELPSEQERSGLTAQSGR
jgi:hypothetical protein